MSDPLVPTLVHLRDGEHFHGPTDRPVWITVLRGRAWITQSGDLDDHFVAAGQSMHLPAGSGALVGADGAVQLVLAKAPGRWQRWGRSTMDWLLRRPVLAHGLTHRPAR